MKNVLTRRAGAIAVAVAVVAVGLSGTALGVSLDRSDDRQDSQNKVSAVVGFSARGVVSMQTVTETGFQTFSGDAWQSLPGSSIYVTVPSGTQRVASVTFDGETNCSGTAGSGCLVRVVARRQGTTTPVELHPRNTGVPFFDTVPASADYWEAHSMTRTGTLTAGRWQVFVQMRTTPRRRPPSVSPAGLTRWRCTPSSRVRKDRSAVAPPVVHVPGIQLDRPLGLDGEDDLVAIHSAVGPVPRAGVLTAGQHRFTVGGGAEVDHLAQQRKEPTHGRNTSGQLHALLIVRIGTRRRCYVGDAVHPRTQHLAPDLPGGQPRLSRTGSGHSGARAPGGSHDQEAALRLDHGTSWAVDPPRRRQVSG